MTLSPFTLQVVPVDSEEIPYLVRLTVKGVSFVAACDDEMEACMKANEVQGTLERMIPGLSFTDSNGEK